MTPYEKFVKNYDGNHLHSKHAIISIRNKEILEKREKNRCSYYLFHNKFINYIRSHTKIQRNINY